MYRNIKPVQVIQQTMKDVAGMGRSLVEDVQKRVANAEYYVNLLGEPGKTSLESVSIWFINLTII